MDQPSEYFCVNCGQKIPTMRFSKGSTTCSKICSAAVHAARKKIRDLQRCRLCCRPTTPEEKASYRAWRKSNGGGRRGRPKRKKETDAKPVAV